MPFGTITVNTIAYEPRTPGIYAKTGVTFDQPANEFRIRGSGLNSKASTASASVTRYVQKDIAVGSTVERRNFVVTLSLQLPSSGGFTAAEIDAAVADISEFMTPSTVSRLLQGES